jgi:glycine/D-amino acid oxidase-like deaminating enzyme
VLGFLNFVGCVSALRAARERLLVEPNAITGSTTTRNAPIDHEQLRSD